MQNKIENKIIKAFRKKINTYDKDGGFIVYVDGYDNQDIDVELIEKYFKKALQQTREDVIKECIEEVKETASYPPLVSNERRRGYHQFAADILFNLNNLK